MKKHTLTNQMKTLMVLLFSYLVVIPVKINATTMTPAPCDKIKIESLDETSISPTTKVCTAGEDVIHPFPAPGDTRYIQWKPPVNTGKPSYLQIEKNLYLNSRWKVHQTGEFCDASIPLAGEEALFGSGTLRLSADNCPLPDGPMNQSYDLTFSVEGQIKITNTSATETFRFSKTNLLTAIMFESWYMNISWDITVPPLASCTLNAPSSLQTSPIKIDELIATQTGEEIGGYRVPFSINVKCSRDAKVTFKPQQVGGSCIGSNNGALRFCLESDSQPLDMSSGQASISVDGDSAENGLDIPLELKPHRGTSAPAAGKSSGVLEVVVTPD